MIIEIKYFVPGFVGFAFYPFIFVKKGRSNPVLINHERIHLRQQKEMLIIFFFLAYILNYLVNIFIYRDLNKAYKNIIFEREAYKNQTDFDYLKKK